MIHTIRNAMPTVERVTYQMGSEIAEFEIGHTRLEKGCNFVFNPLTGNLERIYGVESGSHESRESFTRVETYPGQWYDVDGVTRFARLCGKLETGPGGTPTFG